MKKKWIHDEVKDKEETQTNYKEREKLEKAGVIEGTVG